MFLGAKHPIYFQTLSKPFQNLYFPAKLAGGKYRFIVMGKTSGINLYFYSGEMSLQQITSLIQKQFKHARKLQPQSRRVRSLSIL